MTGPAALSQTNAETGFTAPCQGERTDHGGRAYAARAVPDWLPPFLTALTIIVLLNLALFAQGRRARHRTWDARFLRQLRAWDGRLPEELGWPRHRSR